MFRIVDRLGVSLVELETQWSICDVLEASTYLDVQDDVNVLLRLKK